MSIEEYLSSNHRDPSTERKILRELRELPQSTRYNILKPFISSNITALIFAQKASLSREAYFDIWELAQEHSNVSSIKFFIEAIVPNIGWKRTFALIRKEVELENERAGDGIYHIPFLFMKLRPTPKEKQLFNELVEFALQAEILHFVPSTVWGNHWQA